MSSKVVTLDDLTAIFEALGTGSFSDRFDALEVCYVVNQGSVTESTNGSGLWRYRKWSNGFQEVWYQGSVTFSSASSSVGNWNRATQNMSIPISSMTNITAFEDNTAVIVSGAYGGRVFTTGGIKNSGTQFEAQQLGNSSMSAATIGGWSVYISGMPRS